LEERFLNGLTVQQSMKRTILIIWSVLACALAASAVLATIVAPRLAIENGVMPLAWVAAGMSVLCFVGSRGVPRLYRARRFGPGERAQTSIVVQLGLCEGAGLFACVAWMLTKSPWAAGAFVVAALGVLLAFPSERRRRALARPEDAELTPDEKAAALARVEVSFRRRLWFDLIFAIAVMALLPISIVKAGPAWNWRASFLIIGVACIPLLVNIVGQRVARSVYKQWRR
jgi:hypothetical protein